MTSKQWNFLKPGDVVDIIAPSSNVPGDLLGVYQKTKDLLASIGLIARIADDLIMPGLDLFSTNSLEYRTQHLIEAFTNTKSKAVWAIRGGYGAAKIIPYLEKITPPKQAKLLLGFSDITALHLFVQSRWNWRSLHSPVINQLITNYKLLEDLKPIIFGEKDINYKELRPLNQAAKNEITIEAEITGGNLSIVQTSLATAWQIQANNKIVFLEEVDERGYQIDRMLHHLLQAGIFKTAKAIIFGDVTPGYEKNGSSLCIAAIEKFAQDMDIPILHFPLIGHNPKHNFPLPFGELCSLKLGMSAEISCVLNSNH